MGGNKITINDIMTDITVDENDPKLSRKEKKKVVFRKILTVGAQMFTDSGEAGFSLRSLARELKMNPNNIYNYVSSKRELWFAIRADFYQEYKDKILEIQSKNHGSTIDLLLAETRMSMEYYSEDYNKFQMMNLINAPHSDKMGKIETEYRPFRILNILVEILDRGVKTGEFRSFNTTMYAYSIWSDIMGAIKTEMDIKLRQEKSEIGNPDIQFDFEEFRQITLNSIQRKLEDLRP